MAWTRHFLVGTAAAAVLALSACSTVSQGMGGGDLVSANKPNQPVMFSWQSRDGGISGTMVATLPQATYRGSFVQVTQQMTTESLEPLWVGWGRGWGDWPYWSDHWDNGGLADTTRFVTRYSGKVVANLKNDAGGPAMRCRFHMVEPAKGMSGGGQGECQLQGAGTVNAQF